MASITSIKVWPRKGDGTSKVLANAQFTYDDTFKIKCTIFKGNPGPFIGFPGGYGNKVDEKTGKKIFYPDVSCVNEDMRIQLNTAIISEYNKVSGSDGMSQGEASGPTNQDTPGKRTIPF